MLTKNSKEKTKKSQINSNCNSWKNSIIMLSDFVITEWDELKKDFYEFEKNNHQRDDEVFIDIKNLFMKTKDLNTNNYKKLDERIKMLEQKQVQTNDIIYNIEKKNSFEIEKIKKDCSDMFDKIINALNLNKSQIEVWTNGNQKIELFFKKFNTCEKLLKENLKTILNNNNELNDKFDIENNEMKNFIYEIKNQTFNFKQNIQSEVSNLLKCQKEINRKLIENDNKDIDQHQIDLGFLKKKVSEFEKTVKSSHGFQNNSNNLNDIENLKLIIKDFNNNKLNKANFENEIRKMIKDLEMDLNLKINDNTENIQNLENKLT